MAAGTRRTCYSTGPGVTLIINQRDYGSQKNFRVGTDEDRKSLADLFEVMGYKVMVVDDCPLDMLQHHIKSATSRFDSYHTGPFFLCILTHGEQESLTFRDGSIETNRIITWLEGIEKLQGKPKVVVIEACRGTNHMTLPESGPPVRRGNDYFGTDSPSARRDPGADILVLWSSLRGRVSYIHPKYGSWFITMFCQIILTAFARRPTEPLSLLGVTPFLNREMEEPFLWRAPNGKDELIFKTSEVRHSLTADLRLIAAPGMQQVLRTAAERVIRLRMSLHAVSRDPLSTSTPARRDYTANQPEPVQWTAQGRVAAPAAAAAGSGCRCKTGCAPNGACGCRRAGVPCDARCHQPRGTACSNDGSDVGALVGRLDSLSLGAAARPPPAAARAAARPPPAAARAAARPPPAAARAAAPSKPGSSKDSVVDMVCDCSPECYEDTCPCWLEEVACVGDCHGGRTCPNVTNCNCQKTDCQTTRCSCFNDGWYCDADCHRRGPSCCGNAQPQDRRRRARPQ